MKALKHKLNALALIAAVAGAGGAWAASPGQGTCAGAPMQAASKSTPLAVPVRAPSGTLHRLVYLPGQGWEMQEGKVTSTPPVSATPASYVTKDGPALDGAIEASGRNALSVFIDGPTGFAYLWMRDEGWKFVGRVAAPNP